MTLSELTLALHRWADAHGGKFPDAIIVGEHQLQSWAREYDDRFGITFDWGMGKNSATYIKGVLVCFHPDEEETIVHFAERLPA